MQKIGIIGLGTISKYYLEGLKKSPVLQLVSVCDVLEEAPSKRYFEEYTFYKDYKEMIDKEDLDYVIISTPPATHYSLAMYALENGVSVIIEKPAVLSMEEYDNLLVRAQEKQLIFEVMFHWQNGTEILKFNQEFDARKINQIRVEVLDPYSKDGVTINSNKVKLEGAWIDSGVNVLSMIKLWLPMDKVIIQNVSLSRCQRTNLPIFIDISMEMDDVPVQIVIDWRQNKEHKKTQLLYDNRTMFIENSLQKVMDENTVYFDCSDRQRLEAHYYNYFKNYCETVDVDAARKIHQILLEVVNYYEKVSH